jgi:DNA-directed RNA polymerase specialized sigma54-like protein
MLQMTTLELTDLIQQQLLENPVLEEVATQEEAQELAEKILDHLASADAAVDEPRIEAAEPELGSPSSNGSGDTGSLVLPDADTEGSDVEAQGLADPSEDSIGDEVVGDEASRDAFDVGANLDTA